MKLKELLPGQLAIVKLYGCTYLVRSDPHLKAYVGVNAAGSLKFEQNAETECELVPDDSDVVLLRSLANPRHPVRDMVYKFGVLKKP